MDMYNSRNIAMELKLTHSAIKKVLKLYKDDFESFGKLKIEHEYYGKQTLGGRPRKIVYLNEKQRALLIMYLSNKNMYIRKKKMELVEN